LRLKHPASCYRVPRCCVWWRACDGTHLPGANFTRRVRFLPRGAATAAAGMPRNRRAWRRRGKRAPLLHCTAAAWRGISIQNAPGALGGIMVRRLNGGRYGQGTAYCGGWQRLPRPSTSVPFTLPYAYWRGPYSDFVVRFLLLTSWTCGCLCCGRAYSGRFCSSALELLCWTTTGLRGALTTPALSIARHCVTRMPPFRPSRTHFFLACILCLAVLFLYLSLVQARAWPGTDLVGGGRRRMVAL